MSVAAIGTSATRAPPTGSAPGTAPHPQAQPNTAKSSAYNAIFRHGSNMPQKLPVSRIPDIVNRMRTETKASSAKRGGWYKNENYVDPRSYSWKNLALFSDYQAHMWTKEGGIKDGYKK